MEHDDVVEIAAEPRTGLQAADRRRAVVDLGVALVERHHEIVAARQFDPALEIIERGDGALRVGGRADIGQGRALQHAWRQPVDVRQEAGVRAGRHEDRFGPGNRGRTGVDVVEGIGDENRRPLAACPFGHRRQGDHEQPFTRSRHRQQLLVGIDHAGRQMVAPLQPVGCRRAKIRRALGQRVFRPLRRFPHEYLAEHRRRRHLRLADGEQQRLPRTAGLPRPAEACSGG